MNPNFKGRPKGTSNIIPYLEDALIKPYEIYRDTKNDSFLIRKNSKTIGYHLTLESALYSVSKKLSHKEDHVRDIRGYIEELKIIDQKLRQIKL